MTDAEHEAEAVLVGLVGYRAFKPGSLGGPTSAKRLGTFWIWNGQFGAFYKNRQLHCSSSLSLSVVLDLDWEEVAAPAWLRPLSEREKEYIEASR